MQFRHDVAVRVYRYCDRAVAKEFHGDARMDALRQEKRGAGVPEVVKPSCGKSGATKSILEMSEGVPRVDGGPNRRSGQGRSPASAGP